MTRPITKASRKNNLAKLLWYHRMFNQKNMRQAAQNIGISASTWFRLEQGYKPDSDTLIKILIWLFKGADLT